MPIISSCIIRQAGFINFKKKPNIMSDIENLINEAERFRDERLWQQFHTTKDLAVAISVEAAELNELCLWKTAEECESINPERLKEELADIIIFSLLLASKHKFDVNRIVMDKIKLNALKYPLEKSRGTLKKYNQL